MDASDDSRTNDNDDRPTPAQLGFAVSDAAELTRFLSHTIVTDDGCLQYIGSVAESGYGSYRMGGRTMPAHRAALEIAGRPAPGDMVVDHLCSNRACVRPTHLEAVTQVENCLRIRGSRGLSETELKAARKRFGAGETVSQIARDLGLPASTLYRPLVTPARPILHKMSRAEREDLMAVIRSRSVQSSPGDSDSCWLWNGSMMPGGYAKMTVRCHNFVVSRAVLELTTGREIPEGHQAGHLCGRRRCVNPDHIRLQTAVENMSEQAARNNPRLSDQVVEKARNIFAESAMGYSAVARKLGSGIKPNWVMNVVTGTTRRAAPGPILGRDYERLPATSS